MITSFNRAAFQRDSMGAGLRLADRHVLKLISDGESYDEAAEMLDLDRDHVDEAMGRVRLALGALTDEHAVALAIRSKLID